LHNIDLPYAALLRSDFMCSKCDHRNAISLYAEAITDGCLSAADSCIPRTCHPHKSGRIPRWTERVAPFREKSLFWHKLWIDCGRPTSGAVADSMRRTRARYHYALWQVRRDQDDIVRQRMADALINDPSHSFWSEVKRIRNSNTGTSVVVDGCSGKAKF